MQLAFLIFFIVITLSVAILVIAGIMFPRGVFNLPGAKKFFSFIRFWWMFSDEWRKMEFFFKLICLITPAFGVINKWENVVELIKNPSWTNSGALIAGAAIFLWSLIKFPWNTIRKFFFWTSKESLTKFSKRIDHGNKKSIRKMLKMLRCPEDKNWPSVEWKRYEWNQWQPNTETNGYAPIDTDVFFYRDDLNEYLRRGGKLSFSVEKNHRKTELYRHLVHEFETAFKCLQLKQLSCGSEMFFNENKINLLSFKPTRKKDNSITGIEMSVAKSCYFASYLTLEFYRDLIRNSKSNTNEVVQPFISKDSDRSKQRTFLAFTPHHVYDEKNKDYTIDRFELPSYGEKCSEHLGVNTIAVTKDGQAIIFRQNESEQSTGLAAPSGSGSMDWEDIMETEREVNKSDIDFTEVVREAVHRELCEEAGMSIVGKLRSSFFKGIELEKQDITTDIMGFYRWGSRSGLPGFLCLTRLNREWKSISDRLGNTLEAVKDAELDLLRFNVNISEEESVDEESVDEETARKTPRDEDCEAIDNYIKVRKDLSLPLVANLLALRDAIANDENFWKNHGF